MGVEVVLGLPWLRRAFGGLHWRSPLPLRRRTEVGRVVVQVVVGAALVVAIGGVGIWTATRAGPGRHRPLVGQRAARAGRPGADREPSCRHTARPEIDLNVQAATGDPARPIRTYDEVRELVGLAQDAGAQVISTTASFRTLQPDEGSRSGSAASTGPSARPARPGSRSGSSSSGCRTGPSTSRSTPARHRAATPSCGLGRLRPRRDAARRRQGRLRRGLERAQRAEVLADRPRPGRVHPAAAATLRRGEPGRPDHPGGQRRSERQRHRLPRARCTRPRGRSGSRRPPSTCSACTRSAAASARRGRPRRELRARALRLFDENFTGFMGLHDVMAGTATRSCRLHHPVRLQHPGGRGTQAGARRAPGAVPHRVRADHLHAVRAGLLLVRLPPDAVGPAGVDAARQDRTSPT